MAVHHALGTPRMPCPSSWTLDCPNIPDQNPRHFAVCQSPCHSKELWGSQNRIPSVATHLQLFKSIEATGWQTASRPLWRHQIVTSSLHDSTTFFHGVSTISFQYRIAWPLLKAVSTSIVSFAKACSHPIPIALSAYYLKAMLLRFLPLTKI